MAVLTRRDLFRGMSLAAVAVAAPSLLAGCGSGDATPDNPVLAGQQVTGSGDLQLVSSTTTRQAGDPAAVAAVVEGTHGLGAVLFGARRGAGTENLAISPYSAELALALAVNGAASQTRTEMLDVLGVDDLDRLDAGLNQLDTDLEKLAGPVDGPDKNAEILLDSANALFGQRGVAWESDFLDVLARDFGAGMQIVDWAGATEAARTAVNTWTADKTHDRIPEILSRDAVSADVRLVLVNALYFKAPWADAFSDPIAATFTLGDGTAVQVPTMSAAEPVAYAEGDGWRAGRAPYAGGTLAMTLVLPDEGGLDTLETQIAGGQLPDILASLDSAGDAATLTMPTWTFSTSMDLGDALAAAGMPTAFLDAADFSAMTQQESLKISRVIQQVLVAVDENGTEAAAATAITMIPTSGMVVAESLVLDRPFLFCIHDVEHGTPLFLGRVADPRS